MLNMPFAPFQGFIMASLILAITPGPGVLYIVTRSLVQGRLSGVVSVLGVAVGNWLNGALAVLGLASLFALSPVMFEVVKYAGALYLVYMGVQMIRRPPVVRKRAIPPTLPLKRIFRDGVVVSLLNPKTTLFFSAFLPQFLSGEQATMGNNLLLTSLFVAIALCTDSLYAVSAGALAPLWNEPHTQTTGRWMGGSIFILLGLLATWPRP